MNWQIEVNEENDDIEPQIEGILFASGEPVRVSRLAEIMGVGEGTVLEAAQRLKDYYGFERRGIRLVMTEDTLQLCSSPEYSDIIRLALEKRKPPQLTQTALEVLAVVAYFQPVTRVYIESVRGVDSSYTLGILQERGLIEKSGTLQVPGRPVLYKTTGLFLRTFGLESLDELPELPEVENDNESRQRIESAIAAISEHRDMDSSDGGSEGAGAEDRATETSKVNYGNPKSESGTAGGSLDDSEVVVTE